MKAERNARKPLRFKIPATKNDKITTDHQGKKALTAKPNPKTNKTLNKNLTASILKVADDWLSTLLHRLNYSVQSIDRSPSAW